MTTAPDDRPAPDEDAASQPGSAQPEGGGPMPEIPILEEPQAFDPLANPDAPPRITERDMVGALELLSTATDDPESAELIAFTDEELLALGGSAALTLLGAPYLSQDGIDPTMVAATAFRSLAAHRLISLTPAEWEPEGDVLVGEKDAGPRTFQAQRQVAGVLALRQIPEAMVLAVRTLAGGATTLCYCLFPDGGALEEFIGVDGIHHFTVLMAPAIPERLARFVDPFDDATADGDVTVLEISDPAAQLADDTTRTITSVTAIVEGEGAQVIVVGSEGDLRVVDSGTVPVPEDEQGTPRRMESSPVSAESLRAVLSEFLPGPFPAGPER